MTFPLRSTRIAPLAFALLSAAGPSAAVAYELAAPEVAWPVVAEALFLVDPLPPGAQDLNLIVAIGPGEGGQLSTSPTLQYVAPLGERAGFTVDLDIPPAGRSFEPPALALKVLLVPPEGGATGLSACADVRPSLQHGHATEAGLGLGAIRQVGAVALRVSGQVAWPLSTWSPSVQAGISAALQLGTRCRLLAELMADGSRGGWGWSAGPTVKVSLAESVAVMGGALFGLGRADLPVFTLQLASTI